MDKEAYMKKLETETFDRWNPKAGTCYGKSYDSFIEGFFSQFHDSLFYALVIQFLMVALMYSSVGKGIYWKVLFYASLAGLLGTLCENSTMAFICRESEKVYQNGEVTESRSHFILLLVDEVFWILSEYAIPYLNLIKMKAFARGKTAVIVRYTIYFLFVPFVIIRFLIGYTRMSKGYLNDADIQQYHGYVFGVMGIADVLCTVAILYFVRQNNVLASAESSINHYIKHSSYTILVCVDVVSCVLSFLNIFANVLKDNKVLNSVIVPFHCLKSSFVLILAIDALLFKYGAHVVSLNESTSGNCTSKSIPNNYNYNKKSSISGKPGKPFTPAYTIEMPNLNDIKVKTDFNNNDSNPNTDNTYVNNSYGKNSPASATYGKNSPIPSYAKGSPIPSYAKGSAKARPVSSHTRKSSASRKSSISNIAYNNNYSPYDQEEFINLNSNNHNHNLIKPNNAVYPANKSIVKNYTNVKTNKSAALFEAPNDINNKYAAQNFGYYSNQSKNY